MAKRKKPSRSAMRKKAWDMFSRYIRTRDCLETTGTTEYGKCFTCGQTQEFAKLQAGHFLDGRTSGILFDERGVHAQCYACNVPMHGNKIEYYIRMLDKYGQDVIDELRYLKGVTIKHDYSLVISEYAEKLDKLLAEP